jgi:ATP-dependent Clp protease ATP-binding subunit ClpA
MMGVSRIARGVLWISKNTVIIMTTNLGSDLIQELADKPDEQEKAIASSTQKKFQTRIPQSHR